MSRTLTPLQAAEAVAHDEYEDQPPPDVLAATLQKRLPEIVGDAGIALGIASLIVSLWSLHQGYVNMWLAQHGGPPRCPDGHPVVWRESNGKLSCFYGHEW